MCNTSTEHRERGPSVAHTNFHTTSGVSVSVDRSPTFHRIDYQGACYRLRQMQPYAHVYCLRVHSEGSGHERVVFTKAVYGVQ